VKFEKYVLARCVPLNFWTEKYLAVEDSSKEAVVWTMQLTAEYFSGVLRRPKHL